MYGSTEKQPESIPDIMLILIDNLCRVYVKNENKFHAKTELGKRMRA